MADKKAKEEVTQSPKQEAEVSNIEETDKATADFMRMADDPEPPIDGVGSSASTIKEEEQPEGEHKHKLHVLAADRLNSLVNEANELGITDIVQFLNSDRTGQFYLVYRE